MANAILAKLIVNTVRNSVLMDLLISAKHDNIIVALLVNAILEIKMIIEDKNIKSGKSGWNPFIPTFNLIKFKKSIPKQDL